VASPSIDSLTVRVRVLGRSGGCRRVIRLSLAALERGHARATRGDEWPIFCASSTHDAVRAREAPAPVSLTSQHDQPRGGACCEGCFLGLSALSLASRCAAAKERSGRTNMWPQICRDASATGASMGSGSVRSEDGVDSSLPLAAGEAEIAVGALGATCGQGSDCSGGNCVDGVCCDSPCSELCAACNLPGSLGSCSAAPSDPLCPQAIARARAASADP
jgi:hypothetical protein